MCLGVNVYNNTISDFASNEINKMRGDLCTLFTVILFFWNSIMLCIRRLYIMAGI